jgi:excisionase family DNA binding protein
LISANFAAHNADLLSKMSQDDRDVLLSREEVCAYLRCSLPTLELWARNGEGPVVVRVGRSVRYRLSDVRAFIDAGASSIKQSA